MKKMKLFLLLSLSFFMIQCVHKKAELTTEREPAAAKRQVAEATSYPFRACSQKNNYLENQLQNMSFEYFQNHEQYWSKVLPLKCIQLAQQNFKGHFALCKNENAKPEVIKTKPCLSENYSKLVYNAYNDVQNCFNLDPKSSFLQIMIESGFHINAINQTGHDAGITQFTKNGILRVMERQIVSRTSQYLLESSNPSCERISSVFRELQRDAFKIEKRCSMVSLPQNPYRALVLQYLHSLRDQRDLKRLLTERKEVEPFLNEKLLDQMVYYAYNRGITGTLRLIDGYIKNRKAVGVAITAEDLDLWKNLSSARKIMQEEPIKRSILKTAKIKKLTLAEYAIIQDQHYLANMAEAQDFVRSKLGDLCF